MQQWFHQSMSAHGRALISRGRASDEVKPNFLLDVDTDHASTSNEGMHQYVPFVGISSMSPVATATGPAFT